MTGRPLDSATQLDVSIIFKKPEKMSDPNRVNIPRGDDDSSSINQGVYKCALHNDISIKTCRFLFIIKTGGSYIG